MAAILYRYAQYKGYDVSAKTELAVFADASAVSHWAEDALKWANATSLIKGDGVKLTPTNIATCAQAAAVLMRFMEDLLK